MFKTITNSFKTLFVSSALALSSYVYADTYTVTSTGNAGIGTLRQAILDANVNPGEDLIVFSPNLTAPVVINLQSSLSITGSVAIKGLGANLVNVLNTNSSNQFRIFAIDANAPTTITGMKISGGRTDNRVEGKREVGGAGIYTNSSLYVYDCIFENNISNFGGSGGGIYLGGGNNNLYIENCTFTNNRAINPYNTQPQNISGFGGLGGGIYAKAPSTIIGLNCYFNSNEASVSNPPPAENISWYSGYGGAVYAQQPDYVNGEYSVLNFNGCTFDNNSASSNNSGGGAIWFSRNTSLDLVNCTLYNNRVDGDRSVSPGQGGAIYGQGGGSSLKMVNCISSLNTARASTISSGFYIDNGTSVPLAITVQNSIFNDNFDNGSVNTNFSSLGFNICSNATMNNLLTNPTDIKGIRLTTTLGALSNTGGYAPTIPLLCGSPAINAITGTGVASLTDQRGVARQGNPDIGPFEYQLPSITGIAIPTFCGFDSATLTGVVTTGTIDWFTTSVGGVALASTLRFVTPTLTGTTLYYAQGRDRNCFSLSRKEAIAVFNPVTTITSQPLSQSSCSGTNASAVFMVSATGTGTLTYAWSDGLSTTNAMSTSVTGINYMVTVSGTCGIVVSNEASLALNNCQTQVTVTGLTASANLSNAVSAILVSILGSGFQNGASVTVGGVVLTNVVITGNMITGTIPAGSTVANPSAPIILVQQAGLSASAASSPSVVITSLQSNVMAKNEAISIFPNPTSGEFSIACQLSTLNYQLLTIYNAQGSVVYSQSIDSEAIVVNANLQKGIYIVKVGTAVSKLVVD